MSDVYIETSGAGLVYNSDIELIDFLRKSRDYLEFPGLKIYDNIPEEFPYSVKYFDVQDRNILCSDKEIKIYYPSNNLTAASIVFMGYILMERQRNEQSMVTIHSACVEKNNSAILLLGRTGSGKTTLSLNLCDNYNYSLIGNDRNIIGFNSNGELTAFDGTRFLFLRYESIKRNMPELLDLFPEEKKDSWLRKVKVLPEDLGIKTTSNVPITKSYIIHVDNSSKELYCINGDNAANRLYLNELFSMYIRGMYTTFSDKNFNAIGYVPSYDTAQCYKNRAELINAIFTISNLEYVSGNLSDISEYINEKQKTLVYRKDGGRF